MTLRRSLGQQWSKSILAHRLALTLRNCEKVQQLFSGATSLPTVTNTISALVFAEGEPVWLPPMDSSEQTPLEQDLALHCLFAASRLLFVKEIEQGELGQSEHLVLTIAYQWSQSLVNNEQSTASVNDMATHSSVKGQLSADALQLCQLLQTINTQLEKVRSEKRQSSRNMGGNY
ncbi:MULTISPECIES: hypothetical protein [unclassified Shewanella]|uniref:hypothetical protein n=1 Tax=unclassified Shewanella TaxID=196818 RepID=UPI001BBCC950|nr:MULTISPECIES: hypothetical protein [unclassified Shewanella]GIU10090.1 hypothetical protein TUM4444_13770 [Shewanella sp. MBTL60-112-B1]GIU32707.1 hypothetical protein TUM4445_18780 [Shewanella sp. MBTL60-112-B2]